MTGRGRSVRGLGFQRRQGYEHHRVRHGRVCVLIQVNVCPSEETTYRSTRGVLVYLSVIRYFLSKMTTTIVELKAVTNFLRFVLPTCPVKEGVLDCPCQFNR